MAKKRRRTGARSNENRLARWLKVAGRYTVPGLVITKPNNKWLQVRRGGPRISVQEAILSKQKSNRQKRSVECRSKALVAHMLTHLVDVFKTARHVGWKEDTLMAAPDKPVDAVKHIMNMVEAGCAVQLYPLGHDKHIPWVYVHSDQNGRRVLHARFLPDVLMLTSQVLCPPGSSWTSSTISRRSSTTVMQEWPIAIVGRTAWQTPDSTDSVHIWPKVWSSTNWGSTGINQLSTLTCVRQPVP